MTALAHNLNLWLTHLTQPCQSATLPDGERGYVRQVFYKMIYEVFDEKGALVGQYNRPVMHFDKTKGFIVNADDRLSRTEMLPGIAWFLTLLLAPRKGAISLVAQSQS